MDKNCYNCIHYVFSKDFKCKKVEKYWECFTPDSTQKGRELGFYKYWENLGEKIIKVLEHI